MTHISPLFSMLGGSSGYVADVVVSELSLDALSVTHGKVLGNCSASHDHTVDFGAVESTVLAHFPSQGVQRRTCSAADTWKQAIHRMLTPEEHHHPLRVGRLSTWPASLMLQARPSRAKMNSPSCCPRVVTRAAVYMQAANIKSCTRLHMAPRS